MNISVLMNRICTIGVCAAERYKTSCAACSGSATICPRPPASSVLKSHITAVRLDDAAHVGDAAHRIPSIVYQV